MRLFGIAALIGLVLAVGCRHDGYAELGLVEVSGKVTLDGKPLSGAKVTFEGEDKRAAIGVTDSAGQYTLSYDSEKRGATPGPKTVRITVADAEVEGGGGAEGAPVAKETVPARYNTQSELKVNVSKKETFYFALKSMP